MDKYLSIKNINKKHQNTVILNNFSLEIQKKDLCVLIGPSGCGKTTLLRIIAGFEIPDSGQIFLNNQNLLDQLPHMRPVNIMFQSYALFPHMDVYNNIAFGLYADQLPADKIHKKVCDMVDLLQLEDCVYRYPNSLSGGQQQRVAFARSLAQEPAVLLLDEPLAAIDKNLRQKMCLELVSIQEELGITFIVVTHDQEEAMTIATHIAVMQYGQVVQFGNPIEVYECPNSRYVAELVGEINVIYCKVKKMEGNLITLQINSTAIEFSCYNFGSPLHLTHVSQDVIFMLRPEKILISLDSSSGYIVQGQVHDIAYLGSYSVYHINIVGTSIQLKVVQMNVKHKIEQEIKWDDIVYLKWSLNAGIVLNK